MSAAVLDDVPPIRTLSGRRRQRPGKVDADKGYDSAANRAWLRRRGIRSRIARRGIESSARLGRHRWKVERSLSWLSCFRRRQRPGKVDADKGYDSRANRAWLRRRGIRSRIARRGIESSARLGRHRWKVERSLSWLSCWRRLQVRWDRDAGRWFAFVLVACAVVCFNRL